MGFDVMPQKWETKLPESAEGAQYESQGQARSASPLVCRSKTLDQP